MRVLIAFCVMSRRQPFGRRPKARKQGFEAQGRKRDAAVKNIA